MAEPRKTFRVTVLYDEVLAEETRKVFSRYGLPVEVNVTAAMADPNVVLYVNLADLVIIGPVSAFLGAFAGAAGKDAYAHLKRFLSEWRGRGGRRIHRVRISDRDNRIGVLLSDDLPDEALQALFDLDLQQFVDQDPATWDPQTRQWRPRPYPERRSDVLGWFASGSEADTSTVWHLTRDASKNPLAALCGTEINRPSLSRRQSVAGTIRCPMQRLRGQA